MKASRLCFWLILSSLCLASDLAFGQQIEIVNIEHKGLSPFIYDIGQSAGGEVYVATDAGLVAFNGSDPKFFGVVDGMLEAFVESIEVHGDVLLINYYESGVSSVNPKEFTQSIQFHLGNERIQEMCVAFSSVYVLGEENVLYGYNVSLDTFTLLQQYNGNDLTQLAPWEGGFAMVGRNRLLITDSIGRVIDSLELNSPMADMKYDQVSKNLIMVDQVGTIHQLQPSAEGFDLVSRPTSMRSPTCLEVSNDGQSILVGTRADGVYLFSIDGAAVHQFDHLSSKNGLRSDAIKTLFMDQQANVWIGSYGEGLSVIPNSQRKTVQHANRLRALSLKSDTICFTDGNSLYWVDALSMDYLDSIQFPSETDGMVDHLCFYQGQLYFSTQAGSIFQWSMAGEAPKRLEWPSSWHPIRINDIAAAGERLAIAAEAGLAVYFPTSDSIDVFTIADGLPANKVLDVDHDSERELIVAGLDGGGVVEINTAGDVNILVLDLESYRINNVLRTKELHLISSMGDGLYIKERGQYVEPINLEYESGVDKLILGIQYLGDSQLIALSASSALLLKYHGDRFISIERDFRELKITSGDMAVKFGRLTFISERSLVSMRILPSNNQTATYFPIDIEEIRLNGEVVAAMAMADIEAGNHRVRFEFISPQFDPGHQYTYEYMLDGFESTWIERSPEDNYAYYPNLSSGDYQFKVRLTGIPESERLVKVTIAVPLWKQRWFIVTAGLFGVLVLIALFWVRERYHRQLRSYLQYQIRKGTKTIREQSHEIAEKNREIVDSINYAKRIQAAILPNDADLKEQLPSSFVFFKPKDIVSGDFYWMKPLNGSTLIAAADCTGHGVPGAMVSMVCHNALKRATDQLKLNSPAEILDATTKIVESQFDSKEEEVWDGMDVSLCRIDIDGSKVEWAGANNPLWVVSPHHYQQLEPVSFESVGLKLYEIKANKQPIGRYFKHEDFDAHHLNLNPGDMVYMFSDGFPDQFGGPEGRKYKYKSFKQFLLGIASEPIEKQSVLLEQEFLGWRGNLEQIDDVLVIGIRL